jgi:myo-inositol-1(or 4)-monophosphatase
MADFAEGAAREAGALIRERAARPRSVATKSRSIDLVTDTDRASDALLARRIAEAFPEHALISEEGGTQRAARRPSGAERVHWIVDPLDGTTNFAHGVPQFAVSIDAVAGLAEDDPMRVGSLRGARLLVGVVYDPMRDELFRATADTPSTLNGEPIRISDTASLGEALLATGFPYDRREHVDLYLSFWREMLPRARDIRRLGAAALDLAWVACGRVDAFWEWKLHPWDVAAGNLIVRQAGGTVSDFRGAPPGVDAAQTLATNGRIHEEILGAFASLLPSDAS